MQIKNKEKKQFSTNLSSGFTSVFVGMMCSHHPGLYLHICNYQLSPAACLDDRPGAHHVACLTLLSLSSSFFSHSKSLYRLLTQESFSLKIGRFVCSQDRDKTQKLFHGTRLLVRRREKKKQTKQKTGLNATGCRRLIHLHKVSDIRTK